jgi:hypothetical protein
VNVGLEETPMAGFTRRDLLSVTAGATVATTLPSSQPVRATTPVAGKQAAGWYPSPSLAHVEKYGSGYREIPVIWDPTI